MAVASSTLTHRGWLPGESWFDPDDVVWFGIREPAAAAVGAGTLGWPEPILPARPTLRDGRRETGWSAARRRRFLVRVVPAATVMIGTAAALPWVFARSNTAPVAQPAPTRPATRAAEPAPASPRAETIVPDLLLTERIAVSAADRVADAAWPAADGAWPDFENARTVRPIVATLTNTRKARPLPAVQWRDSVAVGLPYAGRLERGVQLPIEGEHYVTWDPVRDRVPNRAWRLYGTAELVRTVLDVLDGYHRANPRAPRVVIGDLSGKGGGYLDQHVSHQNGLDVDVYYPRKDRLLAHPTSVDQIDLKLAQDLVDRFVAAGAQLVLVGYSTPLTGPGGVVVSYANHDNHMHVRLRHPVGGHAAD